MYVKSPDERTATAFLSVDDAGKFYFNGELLWAVPGLHPVELDEYAVPVRLKAGWNEVLVKVGQCGGNWGFAFRIRDPKAELLFSTTREDATEKTDN